MFRANHTMTARTHHPSAQAHLPTSCEPPRSASCARRSLKPSHTLAGLLAVERHLSHLRTFTAFYSHPSTDPSSHSPSLHLPTHPPTHPHTSSEPPGCASRMSRCLKATRWQVSSQSAASCLRPLSESARAAINRKLKLKRELHGQQNATEVAAPSPLSLSARTAVEGDYSNIKIIVICKMQLLLAAA